MSKSTQRNKTIQTRVSEEEFETIEQRADTLGLSVSNYLRLVSLHANIEVNVKIGQIEKED